MNLMDAVKSGKKFSRKDWEHWFTHESYEWGLKADDILADDWITEEPAKQKVTMWQALYKTTSGQFGITEFIFIDEKSAKDWLRTYTFIKLVNPIEVEI